MLLHRMTSFLQARHWALCSHHQRAATLKPCHLGHPPHPSTPKPPRTRGWASLLRAPLGNSRTLPLAKEPATAPPAKANIMPCKWITKSRAEAKHNTLLVGVSVETRLFFFFFLFSFFFPFFFFPFFLEGRRNISWLLSVKYSAGEGEEVSLGTGFSRYRSLHTLKWILTFGNLAPSQRTGSGKTVWEGKRHFCLFSVLQSLAGLKSWRTHTL